MRARLVPDETLRWLSDKKRTDRPNAGAVILKTAAGVKRAAEMEEDGSSDRSAVSGSDSQS